MKDEHLSLLDSGHPCIQGVPKALDDRLATILGPIGESPRLAPGMPAVSELVSKQASRRRGHGRLSSGNLYRMPASDRQGRVLLQFGAARSAPWW